MLTTELLVKGCEKDLVKLSKKESAIGKMGADAMRELRNCLEDVKDAKRPMERALQTRQSSHGNDITAQDRYYHFRNDT
jgi:hypothetical protein